MRLWSAGFIIGVDEWVSIFTDRPLLSISLVCIYILLLWAIDAYRSQSTVVSFDYVDSLF
jgi:hypothetical protein